MLLQPIDGDETYFGDYYNLDVWKISDLLGWRKHILYSPSSVEEKRPEGRHVVSW
jgi:hypothetical protein